MDKTLNLMNRNTKLNHRDRAVLMNTPFFHDLGSNSLISMLSHMQVMTVPARSTIFRDGDVADAFYCVLSGYVRLYKLSRDGREADIQVCGPSDTFAESMLFSGRTYPYYAQAAETCTIARFDLAAVREMAREEADVARALMTALSKHLLTSMDCVANDRLFTAPQRVANYILERCPLDQGPASIRLPFQKSLLAGKLGLAPEALSRAFSSLRKSGVNVRGRVIQVTDIEALRKV